MPASGVRPEAIAKAMASGRATSPTVTPEARSAPNDAQEYCRNACTDAGIHCESVMAMNSGELPHCTTRRSLQWTCADDPRGRAAERLRERLVSDGRHAGRHPLVL